MYLLFVDESGTHPGNHPFVLGGIAIHENDAAPLQKRLDNIVVKHLGRIPSNLDEYEIHANELRNAKKPKGNQRISPWANVPRGVRLAILDDAYSTIVDFVPTNEDLPIQLFGVAVEKNFYHKRWSPIDRERWAYEVLLNKFDVMLKATRTQRGLPNHGLVIHDRRIVAEDDIQSWVAAWRTTAERVGQLKNLADIPLFGDSRATRLLQAADIVAYAIYRNYMHDRPDERYLNRVWNSFHVENDTVHGIVHYTPSFGQGSCSCLSCKLRNAPE